jgi:hypothetical protein
MTSFSIETASRWDAVDLQRRLGPYSPWLIELTRGRWYVRGSLGAGSHDDLRAVLAGWADDHSTAVPAIVFVESAHGYDGALL